MDTTHHVDSLRPDVSLRSVSFVLALTAVVAIAEASLSYGYLRDTIWAYFVLVFALSLAPLLFEVETPIFQAFALIAVFRLVNLSMPVFFDLTLFWLPLVYGPFIPVFVYFGWQASTGGADGRSFGSSRRERASVTGEAGQGLPWWLGGSRGGKFRWLLRRTRAFLSAPDGELPLSHAILYWGTRAVVVLAFPVTAVAVLASLFVLTVYFAEIEYGLVTPAPLIPSLDLYYLAALAIIMVGFVGFVEELLFRGVLQNVLERRLGLLPGLLLASGIFGLMHSFYGVPMAIVFVVGVGLLFGILYDLTDSLVLVSIMHGLMNVFIFGIIPLTGTSSIELLRAAARREIQRFGGEWILDVYQLLDVFPSVGLL